MNRPLTKGARSLVTAWFLRIRTEQDHVLRRRIDFALGQTAQSTERLDDARAGVSASGVLDAALRNVVAPDAERFRRAAVAGVGDLALVEREAGVLTDAVLASAAAAAARVLAETAGVGRVGVVARGVARREDHRIGRIGRRHVRRGARWNVVHERLWPEYRVAAARVGAEADRDRSQDGEPPSAAVHDRHRSEQRPSFKGAMQRG